MSNLSAGVADVFNDKLTDAAVDESFSSLLMIALVVMVIRWLLNQVRPQALSNAPPLVAGWLPYFGVWFQISKDPVQFLKDCQKQYGDIFTLYICGRNYHMLMNHEDHATFYLKPDNEVAGEGSPFLAIVGDFDSKLIKGQPPSKIFSQVSSYLSTFHKHVATGLQGTFLRSYVPYLTDYTVREFDNWNSDKHKKGNNANEGEINLFDSLVDLAIDADFRCFLGEEFLEQNPTIHEEFLIVKNYFETYAPNPFLKNVVLNLPTPTNIRLRTAIRNVKLACLKRVNDLYAGAENETLLFSSLKKARASESGNAPPRGIVITMLLLILSATANAPIACFWILDELIKNPKLMERVRKEQQQARDDMIVAGKDPNNPSHWTRSDTAKVKILENCIYETVRMHQGAIHVGNVLRTIHKEQEVKGYTLAKGDFLVLSSHRYRDESIFPNANTYDPDRWDDKEFVAKVESEHFAFSPFGHGRHFCPGKGFAREFIKIIIMQFVHHYDFEWVSPPVSQHPPFTGVNPPVLGEHCNIVRYKKRNV